MRETELYGPIRDHLVDLGYDVQGEVKRCDIVARKDDQVIVIELKRTFGTKLLIQAIDRQKITDSVYVALPGPYKRRSKRWRGIERLLRRLELGLIAVTLGPDMAQVEIVFHPLPYQQRKRARRKRAVIQEMSARTGDYNQGGSTRRKVMTAYRENAIHIACCLEVLGPSAPRRLRALGTGPKTTPILSSNFYRWFRRVERGVYELTPTGRAELAALPELAAKYRARAQEAIKGEEESGNAAGEGQD